MKNVIKKISALAMAFTLIGAGSTIVTKVSPNSDTTITASAASIRAGAYKVRSSFNYEIPFSLGGSMHTGTALDIDVSGGGSLVINYHITAGTILVLDKNGKCTSGEWDGYYFTNYMQYLVRYY